MKTNYQAVLFHPEGDYVTDFTGTENIQDVWKNIAEMGSRWIFYPIPFVATDKTIIDTPEGLELLKGKRITTVERLLSDEWKNNSATICDEMNAGLPLSLIYDFKFSAVS